MQGYYENHHDDQACAMAWYAYNDHCTPHFHNSVELVYVLEGALSATLDGHEYIIRPNTLLINSSYTIHSYDTPDESHAIIAIIPIAHLPSVRQTLFNHAFSHPVCPDDADGTLGALMRMLVTSGDNPLTQKGLCYTLLGLLVDRVGLVEAHASRSVTFIRDVLEYLEQHHTESLSVESVAAHFGYSRSRFSHIFNARLGYTLSDYVGALRCRHAAQLLRETEMSVSDVAMAVGFESLRTFYRAFKKQYEMTPHRYARAQ